MWQDNKKETLPQAAYITQHTNKCIINVRFCYKASIFANAKPVFPLPFYTNLKYRRNPVFDSPSKSGKKEREVVLEERKVGEFVKQDERFAKMLFFVGNAG